MYEKVNRDIALLNVNQDTLVLNRPFIFHSREIHGDQNGDQLADDQTDAMNTDR